MFKSYLKTERQQFDDIRQVMDDLAVRIEVWRIDDSNATDPGVSVASSDPIRVDIIKGRIDPETDEQSVVSAPGEVVEQLYLGMTLSQNVQKGDWWVIAGKRYVVETYSDGENSYTEVNLRRLS